jgi:hypothetical protein
MFYTPVYTLLKIKKCVGYEKETTAEGISTPRAEKILTRESVLSGFLDITAASRLVGAADYTKHIRTCYLYTTHWALELHTGRPPYFCIPIKIKKTLPEPHARLSNSHKSVS